MHKLQMKIESPIGQLYLVASEKFLLGIHWTQQGIAMATEIDHAEIYLLKKTATQIGEYLKGNRKIFDLPLNAEGTDFQKRVWKALTNIPYGETRSYKDIAIAIQHPKAYRAVGTANGHNPLSIIVPCHRVIAADGTIGGYAGGLSIKKRLLAIEQAST